MKMKLPRRNFLDPATGAAAPPAVSRIAGAQTGRKRPARLIVPFASACLAISLLAISDHRAWPQTISAIKIVVPVPPGGANDFLARLLAEQIGRAQGLALTIENRAGAGGIIGAEAVSRSTPDGRTLLIESNSFLIDALLQKTNYHPLTSFEPICNLVDAPTVLTVNAAAPYGTLADLIDAARAKPREITLATIGPGGTFRIGYERLRRAANVDITFVPYPGIAPAVNALLGAHVSSVFSTYSTVSEQVNTGRLRPLATGSLTRIGPLPDVPTVAESGYPHYEVDQWFGLWAPAKTPKQAISQLAGWFTAALQTFEIKQKLLAQGLFPVGVCAMGFDGYLRRKYDEYGRVIREANIKAE
jgi:tripartite-type tricarboxylate transporter receptor subunit TctC